MLKRLLTFAFLFVVLANITPARSAQVSVGPEALIIWPAVIVAAPVIFVHDLIFGSDDDAIRTTHKQAELILSAQIDSIPVRGLYTGAIPLDQALYGLLVESRIPFIEIDTVGSIWLWGDSLPVKDIDKLAAEHPYIRLSIGDKNNPSCFRPKSANYDWSGPPLRPATCLIAEFAKELHSDLQLSLNIDRAAKRELRWDLSQRDTHRVLLSVPFWERQVDGQPLQYRAMYRNRNDDFEFTRLIKKLQPINDNLSSNAPYVLNHFYVGSLTSTSYYSANRLTLPAHFRDPQLSWDRQVIRNESWDEVYRKAYSTKLPSSINNHLMLIPERDTVIFVNFDQYHQHFVKNAIFVDSSTSSYYWEEPSKGFFANHQPSKITKGELSVRVVGFQFDGERFWDITLIPDSYPDEFSLCSDTKASCEFLASDIQVSDSELVLLGIFKLGNSDFRTKKRYEFAIPINQLPAHDLNAPPLSIPIQPATPPSLPQT